MAETLIAVAVGAMLTLTTTLALESAKRRRRAARAARLVALDLAQVSLAAAKGGRSGLYLFPLKSTAWDSRGEYLVDYLSVQSLVAIADFYAQNELTERKLIDYPSAEKVEARAKELIGLLNRQFRRPWWRRALGQFQGWTAAIRTRLFARSR